MGLLDGLQSLLFGSSSSSSPPTYQPYTAPLPQYNQQLSQQGTQAQNQLGSVLSGRLNAYQQGGSTLDPAYRAAVLGDAQASATTQAGLSSQQLVEQLNQNGLLNSSATGYGLGQIQKQSQLTMQNAANYLTQQDIGSLNSLQGADQSYLGSQQQAAQQQAQGSLNAGEFGYQQGAQQNQNQYNSQLAQYQAQQQQRQSLLGGLFGLGQAGVMAAGKAGLFSPGTTGSSGGSSLANMNYYNEGASLPAGTY